MNIITGSARGTKLITLEGEATRPTLQRAKEVIFSAIQFEIEGKCVLDLFAGSGQMGLEALSRGAAEADFVDKSSDAVAVIRENAAKTHLQKDCRIINSDYAEYLRMAKRSNRLYDIVFIDPPYASGLLPEALKAVYVNRLLSDEAEVIAEWERDNLFDKMPELSKMYEIRKIYKSGRIYFYRLKPVKTGGEEV